jgi:hypothetical protein
VQKMAAQQYDRGFKIPLCGRRASAAASAASW